MHTDIFLEVVDHIGPNKATRKLSSPDERRSLSALSPRGREVGVSVKDFKLIKVLGQGSFGKVYLVKPMHGEVSEVYAMKVCKCEYSGLDTIVYVYMYICKCLYTACLLIQLI